MDSLLQWHVFLCRIVNDCVNSTLYLLVYYIDGFAFSILNTISRLILKGIPKESLPNDYDPMIIRTDVIDSDPIPGVKVSRLVLKTTSEF